MDEQVFDSELYSYVGVALVLVGFTLMSFLGDAQELGLTKLATLGLWFFAMSMLGIGIGLVMKVFGTAFGEWLLWLSDVGLCIGGALIVVDFSVRKHQANRQPKTVNNL